MKALTLYGHVAAACGKDLYVNCGLPGMVTIHLDDMPGLTWSYQHRLYCKYVKITVEEVSAPEALAWHRGLEKED